MKQKIRKSMFLIIAVGMLISLAFNVMVQVKLAQRAFNEESKSLFWQIRQILAANTVEAEAVTKEFQEECLSKAKSAGYIVEKNPSLLNSLEETRKVARLLQVDELHFFNADGEIFAGTVPKYYGLNFDSGEQMHFFKPMLKDRSLELCQSITPNTAEGKLMQYAAVWCENGKYITQIGIEPDRVLAVTKKNELSYIFSLLTENDGAVLYAADAYTHEILGSTYGDDVGKNLENFGISRSSLDRKEKLVKFHAKVNGNGCYCLFSEQDDVLLGRICSNRIVYSGVTRSTVFLTLYLLALSAIMILAIMRYMEQNVIKGIYDINSKLQNITDGDLDETVQVDITPEFSMLSGHINLMVASILSTTDKISSVLNMAQSPIGVYEYSSGMRRVRITDKVPELLNMTQQEKEEVINNYRLFEEKLNEIKNNPAEGEMDIFRVAPSATYSQEKYVKIESFISGNSIFGVLTDVTKDLSEKQRIRRERDHDLLTGLYSLRGFLNNISKLFAEPEEMGHAALCMIDMDNLKLINDSYGHAAGDTYLRGMAEVLSFCSAPNQYIARLGGDEFAVLIYGCESEAECELYIKEIREKQQKGYSICFNKKRNLDVKFSMGCAFFPEDGEQYNVLKNLADTRMYDEKRQRKKQ